MEKYLVGIGLEMVELKALSLTKYVTYQHDQLVEYGIEEFFIEETVNNAKQINQMIAKNIIYFWKNSWRELQKSCGSYSTDEFYAFDDDKYIQRLLSSHVCYCNARYDD